MKIRIEKQFYNGRTHWYVYYPAGDGRNENCQVFGTKAAATAFAKLFGERFTIMTDQTNKAIGVAENISVRHMNVVQGKHKVKYVLISEIWCRFKGSRKFELTLSRHIKHVVYDSWELAMQGIRDDFADILLKTHPTAAQNKWHPTKIREHVNGADLQYWENFWHTDRNGDFIKKETYRCKESVMITPWHFVDND